MAELLSIKGDESALLAQLWKRYNLHLIALTKGERGSVLYSEDQISRHSGYKIELVDTVGAGDAFTAVLALGMLKGRDLEAINDHANRVAAFVCSQPGATPQLPPGLKVV